jgi:predicted CXXCH cytochrome family protein
MTSLSNRIAAGILAAACAVALLVTACAPLERTVAAPPEIQGAHFVGNGACTDCHTNIVRQFPSSAHGRFHKSDDENFAGMTGCESCHGAGSLHVKAGGGRGRFIVNPGKDATTCFNCHVDTHAEFNLPQHHPVIENRMNCVDCHDPHGPDIFHAGMKRGATLGMARLNESCARCHREQSRPFVFEHEALREGCVVCHDPHGSLNRAMLTERDNNLCLKCHAEVQTPGAITLGDEDHSNFINRASCWASGCHSAVHGSNVSPKLRY